MPKIEIDKEKCTVQVNGIEYKARFCLTGNCCNKCDLTFICETKLYIPPCTLMNTTDDCYFKKI